MYVVIALVCLLSIRQFTNRFVATWPAVCESWINAPWSGSFEILMQSRSGYFILLFFLKRPDKMSNVDLTHSFWFFAVHIWVRWDHSTNTVSAARTELLLELLFVVARFSCVWLFDSVNVYNCDNLVTSQLRVVKASIKLSRTWIVIAACGCSVTGTQVNDCDRSGQCICKPNFTGRTCDQCASGYFNYPQCQRKYAGFLFLLQQLLIWKSQFYCFSNLIIRLQCMTWILSLCAIIIDKV